MAKMGSISEPETGPAGGSAAGRVALVTGAARGNGLAIAAKLLRGGATVFLADIGRDIPEIPYPLSSERTLREAAQSLGGADARVHSLVCDVRDPAQVERAVAEVERAAGPVEILVNNAGVFRLAAIGQTEGPHWDAQMDTAAKGAFLCSRRVLPGMAGKGWGRIVNVSSVAGHRGIGLGVAYTAAKHALIGLTRALAMEVARQGITVNAVCPGTVDTAAIDGVMEAQGWSREEALARLSERHLTGLPLAPDDVAEAVAWLASEAAARVNGTSLFVDDGWHAH